MTEKKQENKDSLEDPIRKKEMSEEINSQDSKEEANEKVSTKKVKDKTIKIKESEYTKLIEEAAENKDKYVRLYAEFDNVRKRVEREKIEFVKYANEELITQFLDVLDNLERSVVAAVEQKKDEDAAFVKGLELVLSNTYEILKKNGVKPIEAKGGKFDHNCHEVMMQEETTEHEDGIVIEVFQKGYYLSEKVIRTAKVKLANNTQTKPVVKEESVNDSSTDSSEKNEDVEV